MRRHQRAIAWSSLACVAAIVVTACGARQTTAGVAQAPLATSSSSSYANHAQQPHPVAVNRCAANDTAQRVIVNLEAQHLWMCAQHRTIYDTPITSGMSGADTRTPTGHFEIQDRIRDTTLTLNTGATYDVRYWIPFEGPLFGFHDSSWQRFPYGSPRYKTDGSHGCVHMPLGAIAFLYRWGRVGTPVDISA